MHEHELAQSLLHAGSFNAATLACCEAAGDHQAKNIGVIAGEATNAAHVSIEAPPSPKYLNATSCNATTEPKSLNFIDLDWQKFGKTEKLKSPFGLGVSKINCVSGAQRSAAERSGAQRSAAERSGAQRIVPRRVVKAALSATVSYCQSDGELAQLPHLLTPPTTGRSS